MQIVRPAYVVTTNCAMGDRPYIASTFADLARLWLRASNWSERWVVIDGARVKRIRHGMDIVAPA